MRVFVLVIKSNPYADYGEVAQVFVTREKAESHASLANTLGNYTEIIESTLVGA